MKILYIHNEYAKPSGEEHAAGELVSLLSEHGHEVRWFTRSSAEISETFYGKMKAMVAGIYNPFAAKALAKVLGEYSPDIVQVQNIYPLISSSIFAPIRKRSIPVVMRCPNYRLFCPDGLSLNPQGKICERCWGGHEINCVRYNCLRNRFKSMGYAARNAFGFITGTIFQSVNVFIVQSEFQKQKFISQGIPAEKIGILAGISPKVEISDLNNVGEWVSFIGRVSAEKGIYEFIEAAAKNPDIPFKVAGNMDSNFRFPAHLPTNIEFVGFKSGQALDEFYIKSRIIVVPSKWYEGFPNVIVRGMLHHKPIITCDIGAMQSIIDDGINGLLVPPGSSMAISDAVRRLYHDEEKCKKYGDSGYFKASTKYSRETIYYDLMTIYHQAIMIAKQK